eukprot:Clim_evm17s7 gene=Clim_evmTU17s7
MPAVVESSRSGTQPDLQGLEMSELPVEIQSAPVNSTFYLRGSDATVIGCIPQTLQNAKWRKIQAKLLELSKKVERSYRGTASRAVLLSGGNFHVPNGLFNTANELQIQSKVKPAEQVDMDRDEDDVEPVAATYREVDAKERDDDDDERPDISNSFPLAMKKIRHQSGVNQKLETPRAQKKTAAKQQTPVTNEVDPSNTPPGVRRSGRKRKTVVDDEQLKKAVEKEEEEPEEVMSEYEEDDESGDEGEEDKQAPKRRAIAGISDLASRMEDKERNQRAREEFFKGGMEAAVMRTADPELNLKMSKEQVERLLVDVPDRHREHVKNLTSVTATQFPRLTTALWAGFNVLFYGLGSKRNLLHDFARRFYHGKHRITVVNGFFPDISVDKVLQALAIDHCGAPSLSQAPNAAAAAKRIGAKLQELERHVVLVVHNIEGQGLRKPHAQTALSILASSPFVHVIASIDHVNGPMLWDTSSASRFNWVWQHAATYQPYTVETSFESTITMKTDNVTISSLRSVVDAVPATGKKIIRYLIALTLAAYKSDGKCDRGISLSQWQQRCRKAFVAAKGEAFMKQIHEFVDHSVIKESTVDGERYYTFPFDREQLEEAERQVLELIPGMK